MRLLETVPETAYVKATNGYFFQNYWDNSSLDLLRQCARKYYYAIVLGWKPKGLNPHFVYGGLYHQALELNDRLYAEGLTNPLIRTRKVLRWVMVMSWGWESSHKLKNRKNLIRGVAAYLDHFYPDTVKTLVLKNGKPAVELSFRFEIDLSGPYGQYGLAGHLDRLVSYDASLYVLDRKTTSKSFVFDYIKSFKPHGQMMQYTTGGKVGFEPDIEGALIDAIYITSNLDDFGRFKVSYTKDQLAEWLDTTMFYIKMAEEYHAARKWPMNTSSCHVYEGCIFREVCSRDPSVRERWLQTDFEVDRWDPLKTREV